MFRRRYSIGMDGTKSKGEANDARAARLAQALRDNLRRRKDQARAVKAEVPRAPAVSSGDGEDGVTPPASEGQ